jgi:hypothetical protein
MPDLFNQKAARYDMESAEENLIMYKTDLRLNVQYLDAKKVFPSFKLGGTSTQANVTTFIRELHKHFEEKKPDYVQKCPLFFDWIESRITNVANYVNEAINLMDLIWFNGA